MGFFFIKFLRLSHHQKSLSISRKTKMHNVSSFALLTLFLIFILNGFAIEASSVVHSAKHMKSDDTSPTVNGNSIADEKDTGVSAFSESSEMKSPKRFEDKFSATGLLNTLWQSGASTAKSIAGGLKSVDFDKLKENAYKMQEQGQSVAKNVAGGLKSVDFNKLKESAHKMLEQRQSGARSFKNFVGNTVNSAKKWIESNIYSFSQSSKFSSKAKNNFNAFLALIKNYYGISVATTTHFFSRSTASLISQIPRFSKIIAEQFGNCILIPLKNKVDNVLSHVQTTFPFLNPFIKSLKKGAQIARFFYLWLFFAISFWSVYYLVAPVIMTVYYPIITIKTVYKLCRQIGTKSQKWLNSCISVLRGRTNGETKDLTTQKIIYVCNAYNSIEEYDAAGQEYTLDCLNELREDLIKGEKYNGVLPKVQSANFRSFIEYGNIGLPFHDLKTTITPPFSKIGFSENPSSHDSCSYPNKSSPVFKTASFECMRSVKFSTLPPAKQDSQIRVDCI